jgi:hypothetical protein
VLVYHPSAKTFRTAKKPWHDVNIFLLAINVDIKFRRYFEMIQQQPPTTAQLPDDVLVLMRRVLKLVDLLYWGPMPTKGSKGEAIRAEGCS